MSHSRQKSDVGALFVPGRPRHYNKYLNNSVDEPNLMDLDRPSGSLNSVAETTSTVFCAVWMYTVLMDRTWCCNTLSHGRFCRCTSVVPCTSSESNAAVFASPQKRSQLAPQSAFGLVPVGQNFTTQGNELYNECREVHFRHFLIELFRQEVDIVLWP